MNLSYIRICNVLYRSLKIYSIKFNTKILKMAGNSYVNPSFDLYNNIFQISFTILIYRCHLKTFEVKVSIYQTIQ